MTVMKRPHNTEIWQDDPRTMLHWYDLVCPFCYVGQQRNTILVRDGLHVIELAFQAHPEIPPGRISAGPRVGPMYATLEREAKDAGFSALASAPSQCASEIGFAPGSRANETDVREVMKAPLGTLGRAALALIGKFPAEEASSNLHRLKQMMETGRVTDTSYSVAGKFAQRSAQRDGG